MEKYSDTLLTYGIIFSNFASKSILATCEPHAGKYSRYMLRVLKLNIAEHDGVWHHSFCTCLYRAGTDALFFPQGMNLQRCHPTLHPTLHIPKLHQTSSSNFGNLSWGNPSEWHYTWFSPGIVPNFSFFTLFRPCSFHVLPKNSRWHPMALRGKG